MYLFLAALKCYTGKVPALPIAQNAIVPGSQIAVLHLNEATELHRPAILKSGLLWPPFRFEDPTGAHDNNNSLYPKSFVMLYTSPVTLLS